MNQYFMGMADFFPQLNQIPLGYIHVLGVFDLTMLGVCIFVFHRGIHRGFTGELSRVLGLIISVIAGLFCLRVFDELIKPMSRWINDLLPARFVLSLLIVVVCFVLWVIIENICAFYIKFTVGNKMDMFLGGVLGLCKAFAIVLIACCICYMQPDRSRVDQLDDSSWVFGVARPLIEKVMNR